MAQKDEIPDFPSDDLNPNEEKTVKRLPDVAKRFRPSITTYPTGYDRFDEAMDGGLREGELITISGRTGSGKTTYAQNLTLNLDEHSIPSLWFTYEMSPFYLNHKFVEMGADEENYLAYSPIELASSKIDFLEEEMKEAKQNYGCKAVFIDHLHYLIPLKDVKSSSLMIGGIVRRLKKLAVDLNMIIFLIVHTRKIYQDESLDLTSIRDSSLIPAESDYVFLIERIRKDNSKKLEESDATYTNRTKVTLAKNRRTGNLFYVVFEYNQGRLIPVNKIYNEEECATNSDVSSGEGQFSQ